MKYKLLKDYPPYKKGDILYQNGIVYHIGAPDKKYREVVLTETVENNPDWFVPLKFITEEGDDLYGNDMCFAISETTSNPDKLILRNHEAPFHNTTKLFTMKGNALQYWAELQAKKRGIEIGTELFANNPGHLYLKKVRAIEYNKVFAGKVRLICKSSAAIDAVITLEELNKKKGRKWEGLSETKNHLELSLGSDLDIDKTCETCNLSSKGEAKDTYPCNMCITGMGYEDHWETKEVQFEVGKWYKGNLGSVLLYKSLTSPGFNMNGIWKENQRISRPIHWKLAAMKEVEKLLLGEAKKKYPKGVSFNLKGDRNTYTSTGEFSMVEDNVYDKQYGSVFYNNKWAEVVKESKLMLGDVEVFVVRKEDVHPSKRYCDKDMVWTAKGAVTIEEWLVWWKIVNSIIRENNIERFNLKLGDYLTTIWPNTKKFNVIGCTEMVSWYQLEEITKAIKNL